MRILVDENVPMAERLFAGLGEVGRVQARAIDRTRVREAEALVVRSVTRVDAALLEGSAVRFVGTATIGTDHVDVAYLESRGIAFASAPGSNARSVAEYLTAALLELEDERGRCWAGSVLGVVGAGHVGSLVVEQARALGFDVLCCDPPRAEREGQGSFVSLARLLAESDVVSLHVPLEREGRHRTLHLIGGESLALARPTAVLVNTSRGAVVDTAALCEALAEGRLGGAVLDVWEGEPTPDPALARLVSLGTPHIAGYSLDGKIAGAHAIAASLAAFLGHPVPPAVGVAVAEGDRVLAPSARGRDALREVVRHAYPIRRDHVAMRRLLDAASETRGAGFDGLRRDYPIRREFHAYEVAMEGLSRPEIEVLLRLGFRVAGPVR